ncbi:hypothetical protein G3N95_29790 [Paraburkholderia sp. Tr-20389]|uniref:hypothetical protein n=1 Tax=Paraburkholderia sp. Tr-20389 TaxID=2703903 RepID=UPI001982643D|nr:hypothetical protein [Paraburkholderia sp. Tr-20389]MBN3757167.1 hypothetical protein [Paraburkholderia sp. Tr-20389]
MNPTPEQITSAARALADHNADVCGVNREDNWNIYGDSFRELAEIALGAALRPAAPEPINTGDRLTDMKANDIVKRDGYKWTGVVLEKDGARCIVELSAVRWLTNDEMWNVMHPAAPEKTDGEARGTFDLSQETVDKLTATPDAPVNPGVTLSAAQLLEALDFIAPDRATDPEQLESEVTIQYGDGHSGKAHYVWCAEYPEEGAFVLDGSTARAALHPTEAAAETLSIMRKAFRVTETEGNPDPDKQRFHMRFTFRSMEELHAADDQWRTFAAATEAVAEPVLKSIDADIARIVDEEFWNLTDAAHPASEPQSEAGAKCNDDFHDHLCGCNDASEPKALTDEGVMYHASLIANKLLGQALEEDINEVADHLRALLANRANAPSSEEKS